jgi:hypothetical protein
MTTFDAHAHTTDTTSCQTTHTLCVDGRSSQVERGEREKKKDTYTFTCLERARELVAAVVRGGDRHADVVPIYEGDIIGDASRNGPLISRNGSLDEHLGGQEGLAYIIELGSTERRLAIPCWTTGRADGSVGRAVSALDIGVRSTRREEQGRMREIARRSTHPLTDVDCTVPVGADAHVDRRIRVDDDIVLDGAITPLCVQEDRLVARVDDGHGLGVRHQGCSHEIEKRECEHSEVN